MTIETAATIAFACIVGWDCWRRHLARLSSVQLSAATVRKELEEACAQWADKFDREQKRVAALEKTVDKLEPGARVSPLGSQYSARR